MGKTSTHENGRYVMHIPFKGANPALPNSLDMAHSRLRSLKKKLIKDSKLKRKILSMLFYSVPMVRRLLPSFGMIINFNLEDIILG